jgi:hypothetical protein
VFAPDDYPLVQTEDSQFTNTAPLPKGATIEDAIADFQNSASYPQDAEFFMFLIPHPDATVDLQVRQEGQCRSQRRQEYCQEILPEICSLRETRTT